MSSSGFYSDARPLATFTPGIEFPYDLVELKDTDTISMVCINGQTEALLNGRVIAYRSAFSWIRVGSTGELD